jgi:hypothetical protein
MLTAQRRLGNGEARSIRRGDAKHLRQSFPQPNRALGEHYAPLQQERTNLVDQRSSSRHEPVTHAMEMRRKFAPATLPEDEMASKRNVKTFRTPAPTAFGDRAAAQHALSVIGANGVFWPRLCFQQFSLRPFLFGKSMTTELKVAPTTFTDYLPKADRWKNLIFTKTGESYHGVVTYLTEQDAKKMADAGDALLGPRQAIWTMEGVEVDFEIYSHTLQIPWFA